MRQAIVSKALRAGLASLALALLAVPHVYAQNVELLVKHFTVSTGPDGIKRSTEFSERLTRTQDTLWISRVLPVGAHSAHDHAKGGDEHKHVDASTAARWITRAANGDIAFKLVPNDAKVIVTVTKTDYGNVGFDGSWVGAWNLIDPATFKRMKASPAVGDLITYTLTDKERDLKIVWNTKLQVPVLVASSDPTSRRQTVVQVLGTTASRPWEKLQGFTQKDYSDYLD